jgi:hypothetical protein
MKPSVCCFCINAAPKSVCLFRLPAIGPEGLVVASEDELDLAKKSLPMKMVIYRQKPTVNLARLSPIFFSPPISNVNTLVDLFPNVSSHNDSFIIGKTSNFVSTSCKSLVNKGYTHYMLIFESDFGSWSSCLVVMMMKFRKQDLLRLVMTRWIMKQSRTSPRDFYFYNLDTKQEKLESPWQRSR